MACLTRGTVLTNELESADPVYLKKKIKINRICKIIEHSQLLPGTGYVRV